MEAALSSFLDEGYEQTTTARICARAGVSNGALFHHFASKHAIADALYVGAIVSFQRGLWAIVRRRPRKLYAALHGAIEHQMRWIEENADLARFVYMRGHLDWDSTAGSEVAALNSELAGALREWMQPLLESGEVRPLPTLVITAIVSGPAHAIARRWLSGQLEQRPADFVGALSDAAWSALRGTPLASAAGTTRPRDGDNPRTGRVRIELLGDDGTVLASGEARAALSKPATVGASAQRSGARSNGARSNEPEKGDSGRGSDR
jgi:AcrR family transcriptional regulator